MAWRDAGLKPRTSAPSWRTRQSGVIFPRWRRAWSGPGWAIWTAHLRIWTGLSPLAGLKNPNNRTAARAKIRVIMDVARLSLGLYFWGGRLLRRRGASLDGAPDCAAQQPCCHSRASAAAALRPDFQVGTCPHIFEFELSDHFCRPRELLTAKKSPCRGGRAQSWLWLSLMLSLD